MYLYEIKDVKAGELIELVPVTMQEVAEKLGCTRQSASNSYHGNYAIYGKYKLERVDVTIKRTDPIWIDWELWRNKMLKMGRKHGITDN